MKITPTVSMSNCSRPTGAKDRGRRRFFFVHIMKTGGTTLVHRLRNHFGSAVYPTMRVDGTDMVDMWELYLRTDRLLAQLAARGDQIELIAGHFPLCTRELLEPRPMTFTLLREPVERTLSYLSSVRGESLEDKEEDRLERTFAEMWGHPAYDPKNNMTRMLSLDLNEVQSPKSGRTELNRDHLERAKCALAQLDAIGLQERLGDFCDELSARFHWDLGEAKLLNTSRKIEVPQSLRARIAEDNALDIELYDFAKQLIGERRR